MNNKNQYCPECGRKIKGTSRFCPHCGARIEETTTSKENKNIRKYLIAGLILAIITSTCLLAFAGSDNAQTYERVNISSTCSLELPNIDFDVSNSSSNTNTGSYSANIQCKHLTATNPYIHVSYGKIEDNLGFNTDYYNDNNGQVSVGDKALYSRSIYNDATGEMLIISGENKTMVDHIADSVKFSTGTPVDVNNTTDSGSSSSSTSSNTNTYYWIDGGGYIHYCNSQAEVDAQRKAYCLDISSGTYDGTRYYDTPQQESSQDTGASGSTEGCGEQAQQSSMD